MSIEDPNGLDYTTPIFIQNTLALDGHDDKTPSATGTFVKFEGRHYLVTCKHVFEQIDDAKYQNLMIASGRIFFNLSHRKEGKLVHNVHHPKSDFMGRDVDIAIAPIEHCFAIFAQQKGKKAIDLDNWVEPHWSDIVTGVACGWLNGYKEQTDENLALSGILVAAAMGSKISPSSPEFTMFSEQANTEKTQLSGLSGGVVFAPYDGYELPIGIVFEGFPGGPESVDRPEGSYSTMDDLMVRGHVLTPDIFEGWLRNR